MDVRYRCCEHCEPWIRAGATCPSDGHVAPCRFKSCPGRMPIDTETEG